MSLPDGNPAGDRGGPSFSEEGLDRLAEALDTFRAGSHAGLPRGEGDGRTFGRFLLRRVLGQGRFGIVFLADDPKVGRCVALKVPQPGVLTDPALALRFRRDVEAAAHLDHPGIVPVLETGSVASVAYIVMPHVAGPTLAAWLARHVGFVPIAGAVELLTALADAVQHAHERGVLHCDLKPANVLLPHSTSSPARPSESGEGQAGSLSYDPKITDFGLARLLCRPADETQTHLSAGTPPYMAPEQARGTRRDLTARCDVHALAAILYELLTGRPPYHSDSEAERLRQLLDPDAGPASPRSLRPGLPRDLEAIVMKGLEKDPARRYDSARALADDLHRFREGRPTRARPVGSLGRAARWVRRRPAVTALLGACAGMAVVAAYLVGLLAVQRFRHAQEIELAGRGKELQEFHTIFKRVRTRRLERQDNWADDNRADLQRLAEMSPAGENLPAVRSEVAAALAAPRLRLVRELAAGKIAYVCAFSPDGETLALGEHYPTPDSVLRVWLVRTTGEAVGELTYKADEAWEKRNKRADGARSLAYSPDRRWLVLGTRGGRLVRWDLREHPPKPIAWDAHAGDGTPDSSDEVRSMMFNRDGSVLVSGSRDGQVRRWDVRNGWAGLDRRPFLLPVGTSVVRESAVIDHATPGHNLHRFDLRTGQIGPGIPTTGISRFALSPDGGRLVTASGSLLPNRWLGRVGHPMEQLPLLNPARPSDTHQGQVDLAFTPGGRWVVATTANRAGLVLWDAIGGTPAATARLRGDSARLGVPPAGPLVAVCDEGRTLLFERQDGPIRRDVAEAEFVGSFALSGDGERLLTVAAGPLYWGHATGTDDRAKRTLYGRAGDGFRWLRQERVPLNGDPPGLAALGSTGRKGELATSSGGAGVVTLDGAEIATGKLNDLRFGPDGVIWAASGKEKLLRWTPEGGLKVVATLPPDPDFDNPAFTCVRPGAHGVLAGRRDGKVEWFDPIGGNRARWAVFPDQQVSALAVRGDGSEALAGGSNGAVARLALPSGEVTPFAEALHSDAVTATAYLDGGAILTASADHAVRLWGAQSQLLLTLHEGGPIERAEVSPQGELFVLVRGEWGLRVWDLAALHDRLLDLGLEPGFAVARKFPPAAAPLTGLVAEVFKGQQFEFLAERRRDANIDFNWGFGPASPFVGRDDFSIRWTGRLRAPAPGKWKIQIYCDDDATVWIDGRRVLTVPTTDVPSATTLDLPAHPVSIRVDYREAGGTAHCRLLWRKLGEVPWVPVPAEAFTPD